MHQRLILKARGKRTQSKEQMYSILKKEIPTIEIYNFDLANKELVRNVFKKIPKR